MNNERQVMMIEPTTRVWRYMSFARFVWMLQKKQLWLSRADLLDDKWEVMIDDAQLNAFINNRPVSFSVEAAKDDAAKAIKTLRTHTFINCWTASEHESHALWRIFCPSSEGVAIHTTLDRLKTSVGGQPVLKVNYTSKESDGVLNALGIATQKRPMFEYEREVRIIYVSNMSDPEELKQTRPGMVIDWDPEVNIESIYVHPEANPWFMETVTETVRQLAPKLTMASDPRVYWSKMSSPPPIK